MATKRVTFRIYPNKSQEAKMHYWRKLHKDLYNACLAHRKSEYKHFGRNVTYFEQQNCLPAFKEQWHEYKELGSHALQATVKGMTRKAKKGKRKRQKSGLNRSILDVGIGALKSMIEYKVLEAGGIYIEIPTQKVKPSQTCPKCGHQRKKELSERVHSCELCGFTTDRDTASAMVILNYARGKELTSLDAESSSSIDCGSMRQLGAMKRQKRTAQRSGCA